MKCDKFAFVKHSRRIKMEHRAFAPDYQAADLPFDESGECVLEEFEVVYPKNELNIK